MDKDMKKIALFDVEILSQAEKISDTMSKVRAKVFYKGINRNGGFISDEFAERLISTIDYAPVKGIFAEEKDDYTDHGKERSEGRIYGFVPKENNFSYEDHKDKDDKIRTYACVDVYIWSALYEEADKIQGSSLSMELYSPSIKGEWKDKNGKILFHYSDASFLGLQILGKDTEPCFEGAGFFTLFETFVKKIIENYSHKEEEIMDKFEFLFSLSDEDKRGLLIQAINTDSEGVFSFTRFPIETYEDHVVVFDFDKDKYYRVNFSKENDVITTVPVEEWTEMFSMFLTAGEREAVKENRQSFDTFAELFARYHEMTGSLEALDLKNKELIAENSTLIEERDKLTEFKTQFEREEKNKVIKKYATKLTEEILEPIVAKLDEYSIVDLQKELALILVESDNSIFSLENTKSGLIPKDEPKSDIELILANFENKK